jgi:hypothetical protein
MSFRWSSGSESTQALLCMHDPSGACKGPVAGRCKGLTLTVAAGGTRPRGNNSLPSTLVPDSADELDADVQRLSSRMALTASIAQHARMLCSCSVLQGAAGCHR